MMMMMISLVGKIRSVDDIRTEADPAILAEYVVALLKRDRDREDLQNSCADNLVEFLGPSAKCFVANLFEFLEDGSLIRDDEIPNPSQSIVIADSVHKRSSSQKNENPPPSKQRLDFQDKEVGDNDNDGDSHKHHRSAFQPNSFYNCINERVIKQPCGNRSKTCDIGAIPKSDPQSNETLIEENRTSKREPTSRFEKRYSGLMQPMFAPPESSPWTGVSPAIHSNLGSPLGLATNIGYPLLGRKRKRCAAASRRDDSRFNSLSMLDFGSRMAPRGPSLPSLFMRTGLQSSESMQNASWGALGSTGGMPNMFLDPFVPFNLQGTLQPSINHSLSSGLRRQCCRDFEERGFCLRGDFCPMEHGANRIVVKDIQSLSLLNLPFAVPSSQTSQVQSGRGSVQIPAHSSLLTNRLISHKTGDVALKLNRVLSTSGSGEADVYNPDQPLWKNDCPETHVSDRSLLDTNSALQSFQLYDDMKSAQISRNITANIGSQSSKSCVWEKIGSGLELEKGNVIIPDVGALGNETNESVAMALAIDETECLVTEETGSELTDIRSATEPRKYKGCKGRRVSPKASCTISVSGIPHEYNKKEVLLSHFRKFGKLIHIHITKNKGKAFIQFSETEAAEAALKAPDAFLDNRRIKLRWGSWDRFPNKGQITGAIESFEPLGVVPTSVPSRLYVADREKKKMLFAAPVQMKLENLESLKEEFLKRQELLAQKRADFRRQLDMYEKQAISCQKREVSEQEAQRHKGTMSNDIGEATTQKSAVLGGIGVCQEAEKILETSNSVQICISSCSETSLTSLEQSPVRNLKLDNHSASFRILPPLPAGLTNVAALKDHFSSFGGLASVLLEGLEALTYDAGRGTSSNCSTTVTFDTHNSAEQAYLNGKCWRGHSLQFSWLSISPVQGIPPSSMPTEFLNAETKSEPVPAPSSFNVGKPVCSVFSEAAAVRHEALTNADESHHRLIC